MEIKENQIVLEDEKGKYKKQLWAEVNGTNVTLYSYKEPFDEVARHIFLYGCNLQKLFDELKKKGVVN